MHKVGKERLVSQQDWEQELWDVSIFRLAENVHIVKTKFYLLC